MVYKNILRLDTCYEVYLSWIVIDQKHQGMGISKYAIDRLSEIVQAESVALATLNESLNAFYTKLGFKVVRNNLMIKWYGSTV